MPELALLHRLAAAHAEGIGHRDLKPEKVAGQLSVTAVVGVKILDFGRRPFRGDTPADLTRAVFNHVVPLAAIGCGQRSAGRSRAECLAKVSEDLRRQLIPALRAPGSPASAHTSN